MKLQDVRLLIVQNSAAETLIFDDCFRNAFKSVVFAHDETTVLQEFQKSSCDLLLIALEIDNTPCTQIIQSLNHQNDFPMVVVLAELEMMGFSLPAVDGILLKPLNSRQILDSLQKNMRMYNQRYKKIKEHQKRLLVISPDLTFYQTVQNTLQGICESVDHLEKLDLLKENSQHLLYDHVYIDGTAFEKECYPLLQKVKKLLLKHTTITMLCDDSDIWPSLYLEGVQDILESSCSATEIKEHFIKSNERDDAYRFSYTARMIKAMTELYQTEESAHRMLSAAKVYAKRLGLDPQSIKDIARAASFLSLCASGIHGSDSLVSFYKKLSLALPIQHILEGDPTHALKSAVAYAILQSELHFLGKEPQPLLHEIHPAVCTEIEELYRRNTFIIENIEQVMLAVSVIEARIRQKGTLEFKELPSFQEFLLRLLQHSMVHHMGATVELEEESVHVYPRDGQIFEGCLKEVCSRESQQKPPFQLTIAGEKERFFAIHFHGESFKTPLFSPFQQEDSIPMSAAEYMHMVDYQPSDNQLFEEIEEDVFELIDGASVTLRPARTIMKIADQFRKYSSALIYYTEFEIISHSLMGMSEAISGYDLEQLEKNQVDYMLALLEALLNTMRQWRTTIFITQECQDIHMYDRSIVADCEQILSTITTLNQHETDEHTLDSGNIDFF